MDARREHLLEHPRVRANRGFVGAVDRHVHDHRGRAMTALGRSALGEAAHVVAEPFDVERGVLHVVADVVGIRLRVLDALLEVPVGPFVRPGVVDRLPVGEQLDRAIDPLPLRRVVGQHGHDNQREHRGDRRARRDCFPHHVTLHHSLRSLRCHRGPRTIYHRDSETRRRKNTCHTRCDCDSTARREAARRADAAPFKRVVGRSRTTRLSGVTSAARVAGYAGHCRRIACSSLSLCVSVVKSSPGYRRDLGLLSPRWPRSVAKSRGMNGPSTTVIRARRPAC